MTWQPPSSIASWSAAACSTSTDPRCAPSTLVAMRSSSTRGSRRLPLQLLRRGESGVKAATCGGGTTRATRRGGTTRVALTPTPSDGYLVASAVRSSLCPSLLVIVPVAWQGLHQWSDFPEFTRQNFRNPHEPVKPHHRIWIERAVRPDQRVARPRDTGGRPPVGEDPHPVEPLGTQILEVRTRVRGIQSIEVRDEGQKPRLAIDREVVALHPEVGLRRGLARPCQEPGHHHHCAASQLPAAHPPTSVSTIRYLFHIIYSSPAWSSSTSSDFARVAIHDNVASPAARDNHRPTSPRPQPDITPRWSVRDVAAPPSGDRILAIRVASAAAHPGSEGPSERASPAARPASPPARARHRTGSSRFRDGTRSGFYAREDPSR